MKKGFTMINWKKITKTELEKEIGTKVYKMEVWGDGINIVMPYLNNKAIWGRVKEYNNKIYVDYVNSNSISEMTKLYK